MIPVRLADGSTVHAFGAYFARTAAGAPAAFWQKGAEAIVAHVRGDLDAGPTAPPGAEVILELRDLR